MSIESAQGFFDKMHCDLEFGKMVFSLGPTESWSDMAVIANSLGYDFTVQEMMLAEVEMP